MTLVASARVAVEASEDGVPVGRPSAMRQVAMACSHSGSRPVPEVQARSGQAFSSERSVLAPEYAGASTITGALEA